MLEQLVAQMLPGMRRAGLEPWQPRDGIRSQMKPVQVVQHRHVERRGDGALLLVATHVEVCVVGASIGQSMDQPGIAVEGENDGAVAREEQIKVLIAQAVRVFTRRLQFHQINHVNHTDPEVREVPAQQLHCRQGFKRRHVSGTGHHQIRLAAGIAAGPLPDPDAGRAMSDCRLHVQPLRRRMLAGDDYVHIVAAAQAVIGHRQQAVGIGRQVHADDVCLLVDHVIDEARVLVGEAVMILPPYVRTQQVVQRGQASSPGNLPRHLQPLGVLVEHRVDDVNERFVGVE